VKVNTFFTNSGFNLGSFGSEPSPIYHCVELVFTKKKYGNGTDVIAPVRYNVKHIPTMKFQSNFTALIFSFQPLDFARIDSNRAIRTNKELQITNTTLPIARVCNAIIIMSR